MTISLFVSIFLNGRCAQNLTKYDKKSIKSIADVRF